MLEWVLTVTSPTLVEEWVVCLLIYFWRYLGPRSIFYMVSGLDPSQFLVYPMLAPVLCCPHSSWQIRACRGVKSPISFEEWAVCLLVQSWQSSPHQLALGDGLHPRSISLPSILFICYLSVVHTFGKSCRISKYGKKEIHRSFIISKKILD